MAKRKSTPARWSRAAVIGPLRRPAPQPGPIPQVVAGRQSPPCRLMAEAPQPCDEAAPAAGVGARTSLPRHSVKDTHMSEHVVCHSVKETHMLQHVICYLERYASLCT